MLLLNVDFAPNNDASTTLCREKIEFRVQALPTSFDPDLLKAEDFMNSELSSVFTNLKISKQTHQFSKTLEENEFDIISKFHFKTIKSIKARIVKTEYSPSVIILE